MKQSSRSESARAPVYVACTVAPAPLRFGRSAISVLVALVTAPRHCSVRELSLVTRLSRATIDVWLRVLWRAEFVEVAPNRRWAPTELGGRMVRALAEDPS